MDRSKKLQIAVVVLTVALVLSLGVMAWLVRQNHLWRTVAESYAEDDGGQWALLSFHMNHLVVYEYSVGCGETNGMPVYSGRRDGPFDVWLWPDYAEQPMQFRYAQRKKLESFNWRMRDLYKHQKIHQSTNAAISSLTTNGPK
jgi:hypothetical protein